MVTAATGVGECEDVGTMMHGGGIFVDGEDGADDDKHNNRFNDDMKSVHIAVCRSNKAENYCTIAGEAL